MEQQKTRRTLKYEFTEKELHELGTELAAKNQELRQLEEQKKSVTSDFGSRITVCKEHIGALSDRVASGYEMRDILLTIDYHTPERNKKTIIRTDNEEAWVEPMNDTDHNLFNQWEERERERLEDEGVNVDEEEQVEETEEVPV